MKNIGIITITDNNNYGNRLQNYAVECILKNMNFNANTIWEKNKININMKIKEKIKKILPLKIQWRRKQAFEKFTNENTNKIECGYIKEEIEKFDYIVVGSDQIWNLKWQLYRNKVLTEIDQNKIIAFSPSFGVSEVEKDKYDWYKKIITNIPYLSVRENRGKELIYELTGRNDVEVLIDPTMLLTPKEWDVVAKKPKFLKEGKKYILNYFLGELPEEWNNEINRIAKENDCSIINLLDKNGIFYECGPSEFLYLEKNAFLVCTDSFHSCVFAILYGNPFIVFDRKDKKEDNMNSRIDTLLEKFELNDRRFNGKINNEVFNYDNNKIQSILEKEREKTNKYLKKALNC